MRWIDVDSSNILRIAYDQEGCELHVVFVAAPSVEYVYENVSAWIFVEVLNAGSVGAEFNRLIRSRSDIHPYRKMKVG